jgi:hypothetical protein
MTKDPAATLVTISFTPEEALRLLKSTQNKVGKDCKERLLKAVVDKIGEKK